MNPVPDENHGLTPTEANIATTPEEAVIDPAKTVSPDSSGALNTTQQDDRSGALKTEVRYLRDIVAISPGEAETKVLQTEVLYLRNIVSCLEYERDDLRRRLDAESNDRRTITAMLMVALPTERREEPSDKPTVSLSVRDSTSHQTYLTDTKDTGEIPEPSAHARNRSPTMEITGFVDESLGVLPTEKSAFNSVNTAYPPPGTPFLTRLESRYLKWLAGAVLVAMLILLTKFLYDIFEPFT